MIEATSCGGVVIFRGKILVSYIRIIRINMKAGFFRKELWKMGKNSRILQLGKC